MAKIKDIVAAKALFVEAAIKHAEATKEADYKTGNKNFLKKIAAVSYLKEHNSIHELLQYLNHNDVGVRLAAATYLLPQYEEKGIKVLEEIAKIAGPPSFDAKMTLREWRNGNLKSYLQNIAGKDL